MQIYHESLSSELELEAQSFDRHIQERLENGHIPDLSLTQPCDWFRNNIWRRPYLVRALFGRALRFCLDNLQIGKPRLLEIGCGPGFWSLELARNGFHVTGLDISIKALEVADGMAAGNPIKSNWGGVTFVRADFLEWEPGNQRFDAVLFFGSLHHFPDPERVLDKARSILSPTGRIVAYEPARDCWTESEIAILTLARVLLSTTGHWYKKIPVPSNREELQALTKEYSSEIQEARETGQDGQSVMDNACYGTQMLQAIRERFSELAYAPDLLLFDRLAAGVRFETEAEAQALAQFIHIFEMFALEQKTMSPGGFMFAGQRR